MSNFAERRCRACGKGTGRLTARPGRTWRYKRHMLPVPPDFEIPTCDQCGEEWLDASRTEKLDDILRALYEEYLSALFEYAMTVLREHRTQRALEELLGLSHGYISKVIGRKKVPSEPLVGQVLLLANDPEERLGELETVWSMYPPPWLVSKSA